jgi:hypothetical protein
LEHPRGAVGDVQCPPSLLLSFWAIFFDFDLRARHSASAERLLFFLPVLTLDKLDILPLSHFFLFFADCFESSSFSPSELSDPDLDFFYFIDSNVDCCVQSKRNFSLLLLLIYLVTLLPTTDYLVEVSHSSRSSHSVRAMMSISGSGERTVL